MWLNTTHMHFRTHLKDGSRGKAGRWQSEYHDTMVDHDELVDQRTALRRLGVDGSAPPVDLARTDPPTYLAALERSSAAAALTARGGFGDFLWAFRRKG